MLPNNWVSNQFVKPGLVAATAAVTVTAIDMFTGARARPVRVLGTDVPFALAAAVGSGIASELAELGHNYVFPHIPWIERYAKLESMILEPILAGGLLLGIVAVADGGFKRATLPMIGLGAASVFGGSYVHTMLTVDKNKPIHH